jgi:hypothetical protein
MLLTANTPIVAKGHFLADEWEFFLWQLTRFLNERWLLRIA